MRGGRGFFRKPPAQEADTVQSFIGERFAGRQYIGRHILRCPVPASDKSMLPNPAELMNRRQGSDDHPVLYRDMSGQLHPVGQNHMAAHFTVMRHMRIGHEEGLAADDGLSLILCPAVEIAEFPNDGLIADLKKGLFSGKFQILRRRGYYCPGMDDAPFPNAGAVRYQAMGMDLTPRTDTDVALDYGE